MSFKAIRENKILAKISELTVFVFFLAKPQVLLENKLAQTSGRFIRNNVLPGFEDKNVTVSCTATGGNPAPDVKILVNNSAIEEIDFADDRKEARSVTGDDYTETGMN